MRARHPDWFKQDLALLLQLLRDGRIRPHVAGRISFEQVIDAHHRLEAGGLEGKLVLCPAQLGPSVRKIRDDLRNLKLK
jgi:NADPH:quinone reductase-like Zn-dependent oxidoreductase